MDDMKKIYGSNLFLFVRTAIFRGIQGGVIIFLLGSFLNLEYNLTIMTAVFVGTVVAVIYLLIMNYKITIDSENITITEHWLFKKKLPIRGCTYSVHFVQHTVNGVPIVKTFYVRAVNKETSEENMILCKNFSREDVESMVDMMNEYSN